VRFETLERVLKVSEEVKVAPTRVYGVAIAWIAIYGALIGVTSLVPLFPYVGGGGYLPLAVAFSAMAPLIMGPAGVLAAFVGGLIGMFVSPAAYPLGLLDVILTATLPAVFVTLTVNNDKYWFITIPVFIAMGLWLLVFPYYWPGEAAGFSAPPQPYFTAIAAWYWIPWLIIMGSPFGIKLLPKWSRETGKKQYIGVFLTLLSSMMVWAIPWFLPYWYLFSYPGTLAAAVLTAYSWWFPALSVIITIITIPIIEGLKRSGLPRIPLAIW